MVSANCSGDEFHLQGCTSFQLLHSDMCATDQTVFLGCVGKWFACIECNIVVTLCIYCVVMIIIGTPTVPQNLHIQEALCTSLSLTWREPNSRGSPITHYSIRLRKYNSTWNEIQVKDTLQMIKLKDLQHSSLYEIQASASNVIGSSGYSDVIYAWTSSPGWEQILHVGRDWCVFWCD